VPDLRLLGLLASLEAQALDADPDSELSFYAPPGASGLAHRAREHLRAQPLRRRFVRREQRSAVAARRD
jgi:hypothetical protein